MNTYTNIFGTKISHKPFYQASLNTWRIARYENDKLDRVFEDKSFLTKEECMQQLYKNYIAEMSTEMIEQRSLLVSMSEDTPNNRLFQELLTEEYNRRNTFKEIWENLESN
tara:strand:+ start:169 stop:501 length:333 start_codon:yes stop_codon:yes gene_type:complete